MAQLRECAYRASLFKASLCTAVPGDLFAGPDPTFERRGPAEERNQKVYHTEPLAALLSLYRRCNQSGGLLAGCWFSKLQTSEELFDRSSEQLLILPRAIAVVLESDVADKDPQFALPAQAHLCPYSSAQQAVQHPRHEEPPTAVKILHTILLPCS